MQWKIKVLKTALSKVDTAVEHIQRLLHFCS